MVYIVIPVHNRINKTVKCIDSIYAQNYKDLSIIVVDDGSIDKTPQILIKKYPSVKVLQGSGSLFWTGAVNLGINYVLNISKIGDWILLVNNDVIMEYDVINKLTSFSLEKNRKVIINALSVDLADRKTIIKSGTIVKSWFFNITHHILQGSSRYELHSTDAIRADLLTGRCLLHPIEVFQSIGKYDCIRFPHYGGDDEFTARANRHGYELYVIPSAIVYLDNDKTSANDDTIINRLFGIRSGINLINRWKIANAIVPTISKPSYFLIAVIKSFYVLIKSR
jgi:GT2 family glycosyltransferase